MSEANELLKQISDKMDKMIKLIAASTIKGLESEQEKIELLDSLGFRPIEIAKILSKSPENVSVQLNIIRKKKEKSSKAVAKEEKPESATQEAATPKEGVQ